jgi:nucleoside diphosphate kinase
VHKTTRFGFLQNDFLLTNQQSIAAGSLFPEEAHRKIRLWFNKGQLQDLVAQLTHQVQPA